MHGWYGQGGYRADDVQLIGPAPDPAGATWNVPTGDKVVFFTVDDGWYRTPEAARFIADHRLPITAFPLPMPSELQPDYFRQVTAVPGSSIQDHTVSHRDLTTLSPPSSRPRSAAPATSTSGSTVRRRPSSGRPTSTTTRTPCRRRPTAGCAPCSPPLPTSPWAPRTSTTAARCSRVTWC
ncbi:polysaccharide deacetylase family protein [Kitasatospora acidiphila]|uniref:Polysaccharide deacetylase family protein n=1 Tax=Kitasatospora acidiphila TaxID=2567942 RepID=A0A540WDW2_9ACTN|nr:polysaccharide deacetylase family protein [Kitasatospora acidiphila]